MTDIQKELQKLKALINQRQSTAIFSNKSNESTKLALGDVELYINDMTRKFSFTSAGVKNPVLVDPKRKALENVEYLNGIKVDDITSSAVAIDELRDITENHERMIEEIHVKDAEQDERISVIDTIEAVQEEHTNTLNDHEARIEVLEDVGITTNEIVEALVDDYDIASEVSFEFIDTAIGVTRIKITPKITAENFLDGQHSMFKLTLSNLYAYSFSYTKTDGVITFGHSKLSFDDGVFIFEHGYEDVTGKELVIYNGWLVNFELKDRRLTYAIDKSLLDDNGITINERTELTYCGHYRPYGAPWPC